MPTQIIYLLKIDKAEGTEEKFHSDYTKAKRQAEFETNVIGHPSATIFECIVNVEKQVSSHERPRRHE